MRKLIFCVCLIASLISLRDLTYAAEHGGKEHGRKRTMHEHGGKEHAGMEIQEPSSADIRQAMKAYVDRQVKQFGSLEVYDDEINRMRKLSLTRIHERVGKTGDYYYSCADFEDTEAGETVDVDLDVVDKNGRLEVVAVRIHKVNGKERYTYDEDDNRIPVEQ